MSVMPQAGANLDSIGNTGNWRSRFGRSWCRAEAQLQLEGMPHGRQEVDHQPAPSRSRLSKECAVRFDWSSLKRI